MMFVNYKAEMAIINAMMNGHINEITTKIDVGLFQSREAIDAYWKIYNLEYKHKRVTEKMVMDEYQKTGDDKMVSFISTCFKQRTDIDDIGYYIDELRTSFLCKIGQEYSDEITAELNRTSVDPERLSAILRTGVQIDASIGEQESLIAPTELASSAFGDYFDQLTGKKKREGIQIKSMPKLDDVMYGLNPQELTIVCAQSGKGKTAFALNIARDISIDQSYPILYANAEMAKNILTKRLMSQMTGIHLTEILRAEHMAGDKEAKMVQLSEAADTIGKSGFHLSDLPVMTISKIRRDFKKMALAGNAPKVVFVDYLGRMDMEGPTQGRKEYEVLQQLAESCKIMARELNVSVVALAQLSEAGTIEASKRIKNPCENLIFLEQLPSPLAEDDEELMSSNQKRFCNYKLTFHKARNGPDGKRLYIHFNKDIQKVIEVE